MVPALNASLLALMWGLILSGMLAWSMHAHLPRIRARSLALTMLALTGMGMIAGGVLLRNLVLDPVTGYPAASCQATTFFVLAGVAAVGNSYWIQAYVTVRQLHRARLARRFDLGLASGAAAKAGGSDADGDDALSNADSATEGGGSVPVTPLHTSLRLGDVPGSRPNSKLALARRAAWRALMYFVSTTLMIDSDFVPELEDDSAPAAIPAVAAKPTKHKSNADPDRDDDEEHAQSGTVSPLPSPPSATLTGGGEPRDLARAQRIEQSFRNRAQLAASVRALRPGAVALMFALCNIPAVAVYVAVSEATPAYAAGCSGCEWYWELAFGLLAIGLWFAGIATRASLIIVRAILVDHTNDDYGIFAQLLQSVAIVVVTFFPCIAIRAVDPGMLQWRFVVMWCVAARWRSRGAPPNDHAARYVLTRPPLC